MYRLSRGLFREDQQVGRGQDFKLGNPSNSGDQRVLIAVQGHQWLTRRSVTMIKQSLAAICVLATVAGCSTTPQNPVDFVTYRNEPLVKQVENGMTMQQVLTIGGTPSTVVAGTAGSAYGTCNNYVLNRDGHQQPYYVSFDVSGHVASKGFMTCEQRKTNEKAM
jgi:osmotically inducible lipoprotein OsmE